MNDNNLCKPTASVKDLDLLQPSTDQPSTPPCKEGRITQPQSRARRRAPTKPPTPQPAKTRALKNLRPPRTERSSILPLSSVFVRLKISSERLRLSGFPAIKTAWEQNLARVPTKGSSAVLSDLSVHQTFRILSIGPEAVTGTHGAASTGKKEKEVDDKADIEGWLAPMTKPMADQNGGPQPNSGAQAFPSLTSILPSTPAAATPLQLTSRLSNRTGTEAHTVANASEVNANSAVTFQSQRSGHPIDRSSSGPLQSRIVEPVHGTSHYAEEPLEKTDYLVAHSAKRQYLTAKFDDSVHRSSEFPLREDLQHPKQLETEIGINKASSPPPSNKLQHRRLHSSEGVPGIGRVRIGQTPQSNPSIQPPPDSRNPLVNGAMAPVRDPNSVDSSLKDAIQKLYEVQSQVHGFVPETQPLLIDKMTELAHSLSHLQTLTSTTLSPNNTIHKDRIAPEVIDYVDDSRNPDIYNREFVELVQRGNAVMNGKQQAFQDFTEIFANALREGLPELSGHVDKLMQNAKFGPGSVVDSGVKGTNGANKPAGRLDGHKEGEVNINGA